MDSRIIYTITIFCSTIYGTDTVNGEYVITPNNKCAVIGQTEQLELHCNLRNEVLQHWITPDGEYISDNNDVHEDHRNKYHIVDSYNLVIASFTFSDAGMYQCRNEYLQHSAEVIAIENSLRITSNVPGDVIEENDIIEYTCDVRYAGNLIPSMKWTASATPDRIIPHFLHNSPGIARSVIQITGNITTNGEKFVCTIYFVDSSTDEGGMARNVPDCTLQTASVPLTVHYWSIGDIFSKVFEVLGFISSLIYAIFLAYFLCKTITPRNRCVKKMRARVLPNKERLQAP